MNETGRIDAYDKISREAREKISEIEIEIRELGRKVGEKENQLAKAIQVNKSSDESLLQTISRVHAISNAINVVNRQGLIIFCSKIFQILIVVSISIMLYVDPRQIKITLLSIPIVIFLHIAQNKSTLLQRVVVFASANEFLQFKLLSVSSIFLLSIAASAAAIGLVKKHNTGHDFLSGRTLKHSLLKWSVLGGIVLGVFMGSHQIDRFLLNQAYEIELNPDPDSGKRNTPPCPTIKHRLIVKRDCTSSGYNDLEGDIDYSAQQWFKETRTAALKELTDKQVQGQQAIDNFRDIAIEAFQNRVPTKSDCDPHYLDQKGNMPGRSCITPELYACYGCDIFDISCRAKRLVKRFTNKAYSSSRAKAKENLEQKLDKLVEESKNGIQRGKRDVERVTIETLDTIEVDLREGVWAGFRIWEVFGSISLLIIFIGAMKSFLYVYARCYFANPKNNPIHLLAEDNMGNKLICIYNYNHLTRY